MKSTLHKSGVLFDAEKHTYSLDGKPLEGITGRIKELLGRYSDVPDEYLEHAKEHGTYVHQCCQQYDEMGIVDDDAPEELAGYIELKDKYYLKQVANEYIVTDKERYASPIDVVYEGDSRNVYNLADIKTTAKADIEYLSWQLSIYAYLFERQNPNLKVGRLLGVWLRPDEQELIEVPRRSDSEVSALLYGDISELKQEMAIVQPEAENEIAALLQEIDRLTERKKQLLDGLGALMGSHGVTSWKGKRIQLIRKAGSTRATFDRKKFEEEHPGEYEKYLKYSASKESITIKLLANE